MIREVALGICAALALCCDGGGRTATAPPPGTLNLSGTWVGEAVVLDASGAAGVCSYLAYANPTGSTGPVRATIAQGDASVEVRFDYAHDLLSLAVFAGDLDHGALRAALDEEASLTFFPCSPVSAFISVRAISGTLSADAADSEIAGTAALDFQASDPSTGQYTGPVFTIPVFLSLRRAGAG